MKNTIKFKSISKLNRISKKIPLRILKFKRPKWARLQKHIKSSITRPASVINVMNIKNQFKIWEKVRNYYKKKVVGKTLLSHVFNNSIRYKTLRKSSNSVKSRNELIINYLITPLFRIDVLLFNLNFFKSSAEARQYINSGGLLVNGKKIYSTCFVNKGDYISFIETKTSPFFLVSSTRFLSDNVFLTFVEVDYYLKNIVIVKDLKMLGDEDIFLICNEYLNIKTFY